MNNIRWWLVAIWLQTTSLTALSLSVVPLTPEEQVSRADAVFHGTVIGSRCFKDSSDMIYTRTYLRVHEAVKGRFPAIIQVVHRGGTLEGVSFNDDSSPHFKTGDEHLVCVRRRADGTLFSPWGNAGTIKLRRQADGKLLPAHDALLRSARLRGLSGYRSAADVTDQAADTLSVGSLSALSADSGGGTNGLILAASALPYRFPRPDTGEPIPYLVDATALPSGISVEQALNAVSNAFSAWAAASSGRFVFAGLEDFGQAVVDFNPADGVLRLQLHDNYNYIPDPNILGLGGSYSTDNLIPTVNWGPGGKVSGVEFNRGVAGVLLLNHRHPVMQSLSTFTEVITHEIGHIIGLAHSSENPSEPSSLLAQAQMYFMVHADGRGASLTSYDTDVVKHVHPLNTPPFTYDRCLDVTATTTTPPNVPGSTRWNCAAMIYKPPICFCLSPTRHPTMDCFRWWATS